MSLMVGLGRGASSLLFGESRFVAEDGMSVEPSLDEGLYLPVSSGGFDPSADDVLTFLHAVPRAARLTLWARLTDTPSVYEYVSQVCTLGLAPRVDRRVRYCMHAGCVYAVAGNESVTVSFDELVRFASDSRSRSVAFVLPRVRPQLPDGFCYLQSSVGGPLPILAAIFGPYPVYSDVRPFLRASTRGDVHGDIAHVSPDGAVLLEDVSVTGLRVGGPVCWNQDRTHGLRECEVCARFYQPKCPRGVEEALGSGADSLRHLESLYTSPDQHDLDVVCLVEPARQVVKPGGLAIGGHDRLGILTAGANGICMPHAYWAVWLDKGEGLRAGGFHFAPVTFGGGLLVGYGSMAFEYMGPRELLVWREYSHSGWVKFQHTVMRLGLGSAMQSRVGKLPSPGNTWMLIPGSGMRSRSKYWSVGSHPSDAIPGRIGSTESLGLEVFCKLSGVTARALEVGVYVTALKYTGKVRLGGALQFGRDGGVIVWSSRSTTVDLELGDGASVTVFSRPYTERKTAGSWASYSAVVVGQKERFLAQRGEVSTRPARHESGVGTRKLSASSSFISRVLGAR